jgi:hypothetical protein
MDTAETVEIKTDWLNEEILKIAYQLERLDDIALSVDNRELEVNLRGISGEIRRSIDVMRNELEPDEPWLAG